MKRGKGPAGSLAWIYLGAVGRRTPWHLDDCEACESLCDRSGCDAALGRQNLLTLCPNLCCHACMGAFLPFDLQTLGSPPRPDLNKHDSPLLSRGTCLQETEMDSWCVSSDETATQMQLQLYMMIVSLTSPPLVSQVNASFRVTRSHPHVPDAHAVSA